MSESLDAAGGGFWLDMRLPDGVHLSREEILALREVMEAEIRRMVSERVNGG